MSASVRDVVESVHRRFPPSWAESWDRVGLLVGDADASVRRAFVSLDPTRESVRRASDAGADLLYTHHPIFLEGLTSVLAGPTPGGVAFEAARLGVALAAAHTNLDRAPGAADALCAAIGLEASEPLESGVEPADVVTVYVPDTHADAVVEAMRAAGAGRVGEYEGCAFLTGGEGRFTPGEGTRPFAGTAGRAESVAEVRLEMTAPPGSGALVAEAAARAHPYEEPLVTVSPASMRRGAARMGRLCRLGSVTSLGSLASTVADSLAVTPRVWGPDGLAVTAVAVATGSAGALVPAAAESGASVLVAGEVRYHDAMDALERGLAVIEAGHDATEWPLVPVLAEAVRSTPGLEPGDVVEDEPAIRWWTP